MSKRVRRTTKEPCEPNRETGHVQTDEHNDLMVGDTLKNTEDEHGERLMTVIEEIPSQCVTLLEVLTTPPPSTAGELPNPNMNVDFEDKILLLIDRVKTLFSSSTKGKLLSTIQGKLGNDFEFLMHYAKEIVNNFDHWDHAIDPSDKMMLLNLLAQNKEQELDNFAISEVPKVVMDQKRTRAEEDLMIHQKFKRIRKIPDNWIDVSEFELNPILIVVVMDPKSVQYEGFMIKSKIMEAISNTDQQLPEIIDLQMGHKCCKVYTESQQTRQKLKRFLLEMLSIDGDVPEIRIPDLVDPRILLENVEKPNSLEWDEWLIKLKTYNKWPQSARISINSMREHPSRRGQKQLTLNVDTTVRSLIQSNNGKVNIGYKMIEIIDVFSGTSFFCRNCARWGHLRSKPCKYLKQCFICSSFHGDQCPVYSDPEKWLCPRDNQRNGHHALSLDCPVYLKLLKIDLERTNHVYHWVIVDKNKTKKFYTKRN